MEVFESILHGIFMVSSRTGAMLLFCWQLKHRKYFPLRLLAPVALCVVLEFLLIYPDNLYIQFALNIVVVVAMSLTMWLCFNERYFSVLFCCIAGKCTMHLAESIGRAIFLQFGDSNTYISFVIYAVVYTAMYFIFARRIKSEECIGIDKWKTALFALIVILVSDLLVLVFNGLTRESSLKTIIYLLNIIVCFITLCLQFGLLAESKMKHEEEIINQLRIKESEQYNMSQDTLELISIKHHDIKNMLQAYSKFSSEELKDIEQTVDSYNITFKTGNRTLDTALTEKAIVCKNMNIRFECIANGKELGFMSDVDIYSLMLNALNNAIESADKIEEPDKRVIWLNVSAKGKLLKILVQNYYVEEPVIHKNLIPTTKTDKRYHGYGLKSMNMIVKSYNGALSIKAEDKLFSLCIMIPIP